MELQRTIMTIAGSDSSGGAGIQADLRTFAALGHYGTSVITALTAQNTTGVQGVHGVPPSFLEQQIHSVLDDLDVHAIKTGMLFDAENTRATVRALKKYYSGRAMPPLVCDPVCVSTSGHSLLAPEALENCSYLARFLQFKTCLMLPGDLLRCGPRGVLVKGGHMTATIADVDSLARAHPEICIMRDGLYGDDMEILSVNTPEPTSLVIDVLCEADGPTTLFVRPRIDSTSTHGTGCTLSAALACALADGASVSEAATAAAAFTHLGIRTATKLGAGHGPLNHLHSVTQRLVPPRTPTNPYPLTQLLIKGSAGIWREYVEHPFVQRLGEGTLPKDSFVRFITQDYHYLKYYARAYGQVPSFFSSTSTDVCCSLLAAKSDTFPAIASATQTILNVLREISMHRAFCAEFGVSAAELEQTREAAATSAYGGYLIDVGMQGDTTKLLVALLACLLGYGEVGLWLKRAFGSAAGPERSRRNVVLEGHPYRRWIEDYSGKEYQYAVRAGLETIEACAAADPPSAARLAEWRAVWERCTRLEKALWDMALEVQD
ncbi:hypothetical protein MSAN_01252100 [Mycena sanguinolenta]|uniref:Phosphomethylpyrimidine kinase n=1 Tax=Mycena sanguinolenta TaxID=230812 RepID=A0A8H6YIC6_9AGAR|nr:hypothetical protein MSAN_01252100 [Mycena sanguinolenta]